MRHSLPPRTALARVWRTGLFLLVVAATAPAAWAHGGAYQPPPEDPPPGDVPPGGGGPTTGGGDPGGPFTGPGGDPGGPSTGGGGIGGPTTGGGPGKGPTTGGGAGSSPPSGGGGGTNGPTTGGPGTGPGPTTGGPTTGGGAPTGTTPPRSTGPKGGLDPDHWTRWWYSNRSNLIDFDTRVGHNAASTPGRSADGEMWRAEAQLALAEALTDRDEDISSGAAIALGKCGDPSDAPRLTALLLDRSRQQPVREAAALGIALLGTSSHPSSADATNALEKTVADTREAERLRAVCTWALGLRKDPASVPFLLDLADAKAPSWDVPGAATSALGLSGCDLAVEPLTAWFEGTSGRRRRETGRRVHAAHALSHLGDGSVVPVLRAALRDDDEDVRRAAVLALGALAPKDDDVTITLLGRALDRDRDRGVRNMAALSLGRIGGKGAERPLRWAYKKGDGLTQPFAALGLGLLARATDDAALMSEIRSDLKDRANADLRGALAVALGIARDRTAAKTLRDIVSDRGDPELRAHAALALGLIRDEASADALRAVLTDTRDPVLQRETAMALGLLGDAKSLDVLEKLVADGSSLYVQGASAMALGRIGGDRAAKTLATLLSDKKRAGLARGFAAVGLGFILDRTAGRGLGRVGTNLDWYYRTPSVDEILTIL